MSQSDTDDVVNDFRQPMEWSDLVLEVESTKLHFSKAYLAAWSPVFRRMFYGDFKENSNDVLHLPDKSVEEVQELLRCICPAPTVKPITGENVFTLLRLADEYRMSDLLQRCSDVLKQCIRDTTKLDFGSTSVDDPSNSHDLSPLEALRISCDIGLSDLTKFLLPHCANQPLSELEKYHSTIPVNILSALYNAKLKLMTAQMNTNGAVTFAIVSYTSGSYNCSLCGKSGSGQHSNCAVCTKTFCAQASCTRQHACSNEPLQKVVFCNVCKVHTPVGGLNSKCKCFKYEWSADLLENLPKRKVQ